MKNHKIAIFPGHVGKDSGAVDRVQGHEEDSLMTIEAVVNGQVANLLKTKLDNHGIKNGIYIGSFRDRIENSKMCSLGVSLHCDSYLSDRDVNGATIFHYPGSLKGRKFSDILNYEFNGFLKNHIRIRGIKSHSYYILSNTSFPCLLLEMGFLSNVKDEGKLNDYKIQNLIAHSLLCSIINYMEGEAA